MRFRQFFTDDEVLMYSTLATAITSVKDEESFHEFTEEVQAAITSMSLENQARLLTLGILMGAYTVQRFHDELNQAKRN